MDRIFDIAGLLVTGAIIIAVATNPRTRSNVAAVMNGFSENIQAMTGAQKNSG